MKVSQALENRMSVRAFKDQAVDTKTLVRVFKHAARAPSGGNVQPWRIVILTEDKLAAFRVIMQERLSGVAHPRGDKPQYQVYPAKLKEPYRTARFEVGEAMYGLLGISREDKPARLEWFARNYNFFDAPAAAFCFVENIMGPPQWADLGMYLQSVMLLFQEEGIDTCPQECWARYPDTVSDFCEIDHDWMLFCGLAIGYRDRSHPVNNLRSSRMAQNQWLTLL